MSTKGQRLCWNNGQPRAAAWGLVCLCVLTATLHAEGFPLTPDRLVKESDLVFVGQIVGLKVGTEPSHVETGFDDYDWAIDLTLRIEAVEKGQGDPSGTIVARCFRIKSRTSITGYVSVSGNHPIPDVGTRVRAHLYRQGGLWRVVFPNGLAPVSGQAPLTDAAAVGALSSRAYTFWLPVELWICLAVIVGVFWLILAFINRAQ